MDVGLYEAVLSFRRGERLSSVAEYGYNEAQLALRQDMAAGRLVWYEDWIKDWWCFLRNTHPVFAAFASHSLHVVGKIERYWIYGMLICAYWLMAALAVETHECVLEPTCNSSVRETSTESFLRHVTLLAVDVHEDGYERNHGSAAAASLAASPGPRHGREPPDAYMCCLCEDLSLVSMYSLGGSPMLALLFAVITVVIGQLWFLAAACGCCQYQTPAVRHRWERVAHLFLFLCGVLLATTFAVAYKYMQGEGLLTRTWGSFAVVKAASITGAFVIQSAIFAFAYRHQRHMSQRQLAGRYHVTVSDVNTVAQVRDKLGLPPLDTAFKAFNGILPNPGEAVVRWGQWLDGLTTPQLVMGSGACVFGLWLAATVIAGSTFVAVYVQHHRHFYPRLWGNESPASQANLTDDRAPRFETIDLTNASLGVLGALRDFQQPHIVDAPTNATAPIAVDEEPLPPRGRDRARRPAPRNNRARRRALFEQSGGGFSSSAARGEREEQVLRGPGAGLHGGALLAPSSGASPGPRASSAHDALSDEAASLPSEATSVSLDTRNADDGSLHAPGQEWGWEERRHP